MDITITPGAAVFTAGQSYNLTCTATLENATRTPTVEWLGPNNNSLHGSSDITVGDTVTVNCSTYTTTLQFTTLRTSHSGQYSCQATLGAVNITAAVNVTVLSKNILCLLQYSGSGLTFCLLVFSMLRIFFSLKYTIDIHCTDNSTLLYIVKLHCCLINL